MKRIIYILPLLICLISCLTKNSSSNEKNYTDSDTLKLETKGAESNNNLAKEDSNSVPPCYWHDLNNIRTPNGIQINYRLVDDSIYFIEWGKENNLRTLPDTFYCDAPAFTKPRFIEGNENYLVLRFGCGSLCWAGIFLPLNKDRTPQTIYYYYDYDLENDLVVYADSEEEHATISVKNLKTEEILKYKMEVECESAIPTYCIDSLSIQNGELYYKWIPETYVNSEKGIEKRIMIKE